MKILQTGIIVPKPKIVHADFYLSKASEAAAGRFRLGGRPAKISLDRSSTRAAVVTRFELPRAAALKLGRKENLVECIATGIQNKSSVGRVHAYLKKLKVPSEAYEKGQLFFVSVRRRKVDSKSPGAMLLSKQSDIAREDHFILGATKLGKEVNLALIPGIGMGAFIFPKLLIPLEFATDPEPEPEPEPEQYPDPEAPSTQDFALCYQNCISNVPDWLLAVTSGICGGCVTAIGVAVASEGIAIPVLIAVCAACAVAVGVVLGNCLLTCHEMLGD